MIAGIYPARSPLVDGRKADGVEDFSNACVEGAKGASVPARGRPKVGSSLRQLQSNGSQARQANFEVIKRVFGPQDAQSIKPGPRQLAAWLRAVSGLLR